MKNLFLIIFLMCITIAKTFAQDDLMKMLEDGIVKALQGTTSIEEILRVTKD